MAFLAVESWNAWVSPIREGSLVDYLFKIIFIWVTVTAAVVSLRHGKWITTVGAILKVFILCFFVFTTLIYGLQNGFTVLSFGDFKPDLYGLFGLVPLLLFAYVGFESANSAGGEMKNPARDVPVSISRSALTAAACYLIPVLAILLVVPRDEITGVGGLLDAVNRVYSVYGGAADFLMTLTTVLFVLALVAQGAAWMIISDRMQAMAAADGSFFGGFFGRFSERLGTPTRVNMLSGVVGTVFMLAAMQVTGSSADLFVVVLLISITTFLLSYLLVIPAAVKLRGMYPEIPRPFRVPVSDAGFKALVPCASPGSCSAPGSLCSREPWSVSSGWTTRSWNTGVSRDDSSRCSPLARWPSCWCSVWSAMPWASRCESNGPWSEQIGT